MNIIETALATQAVFSDDETKRFLLKKTWNPSLPKLTICMLAPSIASGIELDSTTSLVLNNASALGFGSVSIVNLFATLGDFSLSEAEDEDPENLNAIVEAAKSADVVIYAPGVGKAKLQAFQERSKQVLEALRPHEKKLKCLTSASGKTKLLHPLCPSVRKWTIPYQPAKIAKDFSDRIHAGGFGLKNSDAGSVLEFLYIAYTDVQGRDPKEIDQGFINLENHLSNKHLISLRNSFTNSLRVHIKVIKQTGEAALRITGGGAALDILKDPLQGFVQIIILICPGANIAEQFARQDKETLLLDQALARSFGL